MKDLDTVKECALAFFVAFGSVCAVAVTLSLIVGVLVWVSLECSPLTTWIAIILTVAICAGIIAAITEYRG